MDSWLGFVRTFGSMQASGVVGTKIPVRSGVAERWVRTVRADCLGWTLIWNRRHLVRVLHRYIEHYNTGRPHRGFSLQTPISSGHAAAAPLPLGGGVERVDVLGGLVHEYRRAA
jgi:hypothetical protein